MAWYYAVSNQRLGPVSEEEFGALVTNGTITPATLVWRQGMPDWLPYAQTTAGGAAPEDPDSAVCAVSGKRYPKSQMLQYEGRWVSAEHRDVFFQRLREGLNPAADTMPGPYGYAGFWRRAGAWIIDYIAKYVLTQIVNIPLTLLMVGTAMWKPTPAPDIAQMGRMFAFIGIMFVLDLAVHLLYSWFFISKFQATPGKLALGLKIVRSDGAKLSNGRIIGRFFAEWINGFTLCIGYMMAGWDDEKRALHDRICDTRVIRTR